MTWVTFFAAPEDFPRLLEGLLAGSGRRLYEVYSRPGHHTRSFASPAETAALELGLDLQGNGVAAHLALWIPEIMSAPAVRQISLKAEVASGAGWREAVEGCGLIWLQTGGLHGDSITASSIGWFTQRTAESECTVKPGPSSVNWPAHAVATRALTRLIRHELATAQASRHPVLPNALARHRSGARLLTGLGVKRELRVEAA